jgi:hypothetical protein
VAYKAFISYSHAADGKLAPALQSALHRFAKPWYRLRAIRVFRDKTTLALTPALWPAIEKALSESEYFILLASPQAAESPWVQQEIDYWLTKRSADRHKLLIILTGGEFAWDRSRGNVDWDRTTALPRTIAAAFPQEPFFLDLRWGEMRNSCPSAIPNFAMPSPPCPPHSRIAPRTKSAERKCASTGRPCDWPGQRSSRLLR